ncbi:MAG: Do family serine endopeptidase [Candidatus Cloacimonetes bacterium]|nr:Do family serine endopeptidase [Candidatus Cloacimonadota bacterium]MCF7813770.1 Do family serine endopeptidase [Candidatus Cloacimonadota bacterium]MCF7868358.1 Do family serine endopeptidase [Candidatus Cloacimonadota bacterium]MCF7883832.1 Do family serine endopeptidase [Candidatus Cloacimonadota bacterium]
MKFKILIIVLIAAALAIQPLNAQYPVTADGKSPFVDVVKNIRESVVNIQVEYEQSFNARGQLPFNDDFFKFFFPNPPQMQPRKSVSMGSGFIFEKQGQDVYIITNNHVVQNGEDGEITVTLADKAKYTAEIVGLDSETDLAVIKIEVEEFEQITVVELGNSDNLEIGDWAIAIGNPFGQLGLERTVTVGVISATGRANLNFGSDSPIYQDYIQTDAAINPGNSGGPLLNLKGEVIGVNAAITSTSGGNVGIGFAIPVNLAKKVSQDLMEKGQVVRAYIGILPQEIDSDLRESLDLDKVQGVLVTKVEEDTPAEEAGLKRGDVIIEFGGSEIENVAKFRILIANSEIGKEYPLKVIRNNKEKKLKVTLVPRPDLEEIAASENDSKQSSELGLQVESVNGDFARRNNINEDEGVIITKIEPDSPAASSQLKVGDIILEIDQKKIDSVKDFRQSTDDIKEDVILLYIKTSSGNYQYVTVKID